RCFIVLFPWAPALLLPLLLAERLLLPRRAPKPALISARIEKPCSSLRSSLISALQRSLRSRSLPSGASRMPFAPRSSALSALLPSFSSARCCRQDGLVSAFRRPPNPADLAPALPPSCWARCAVRLRCVSAACGQSRNWPRCDKPTCRNLRAIRIGQGSGKRARKLLEPLPRRRAHFP